MNRVKKLFNTGYIVARSRFERTIPFWPIAWVERLQTYRLRAIMRHAYDTVPFYNQAMEDRGLHPTDFRTAADLSKLPIIDGVAVRSNIEAFQSTSYLDNSRQTFRSSGSQSGVRRVIYWDNTSLFHKLAYHERDRVVLNNLLGQGSHHRKVSILPPATAVERLRDFWQERTFISRSLADHYTQSEDEPFESTAERINTIRPQVVFSAGSYAEHFFRFLANHQLSIALPHIWIYSADMLSPGGRELIEKTFNCPIYSTYSTVETGRLGFQCEHREGFHLNIDLCAVSLADENGRKVETGQLGEVVVSNLYNRAMVLLNYRLDDLGVMASEPCPCGRSLPLLERLEGRRAEVLYLADGRTVTALMLQGLCGDELKAALQAQIVHPAPGHIKWRIVPFSHADREKLRRSLLERCSVVLGEGTEVEVEFAEEIPRTPQGKFIRVVSRVEGPEP
jgi:phenylacetate-CoA ligase